MAGHRNIRYIAIIGDMVGSKKLGRPARAKTQLQFEKLLISLNRKYASHLLVNFSITLGDEFQGIVCNAVIIPDLIWDIESGISEEFRLGFGYGQIYTPIGRLASKMDGPALHSARRAIQLAADHSFLGGMFKGFGEVETALNAFAHVLWFQRSRWTAQQRKIAARLRGSDIQSQIAKKFNITRQTVSQHVAAIGWQQYSEAERAWRDLLRACVDEGEELSVKRGC